VDQVVALQQEADTMSVQPVVLQLDQWRGQLQLDSGSPLTSSASHSPSLVRAKDLGRAPEVLRT
jgi:hypothetical protein